MTGQSHQSQTARSAKTLAETRQRNSNVQQDKTKDNSLISNLEYKVIPNPNNGAFELVTSSNNPVRCEVTDIAGRVLEFGYYKPTANKIQFNLNNLSKGIYHLKVIDSLNITTIKIMIN